MRTGRLASLLLLASLPACAANHEAQGAPGQELAGCYQIQRTEGARTLDLPWGFELLDEPLEGWGNLPDARQALTAISPTERRDHPFAYWLVSESDSVEIGHPGGGGFYLALAPEGQDLVGVGRAVGDALPFGDTGERRGPEPVAARKVVCGAT